MWEVPRARRSHRRALRQWQAGQTMRALASAARTVELLERHHSHRHGNVGELAAAAIVLADFHVALAAPAAAESILRRAEALPTLASAHPEAALRVILLLGNVLRLQGRYGESLRTLRCALDRATGEPPAGPQAIAAAYNAVGIVLKDTARYSEADEHYALALHHCPPGPSDLRADVLHNLSGLAYARGRFADAERSARHAVAVRRQIGHHESTALAADLAVLGAALAASGHDDDAEELFRHCLSTWTTRFGGDHYEVAVALHNLGMLHQRRKDVDAASDCLHAALRIKQRRLGTAHAEVGVILNNIGVLHENQGRVDVARRHFDRSLSILDVALGSTHPATVRCRHNLEKLSP